MAEENRKNGLIRYKDVHDYALEGVHGGGLEDEDFSAIVNAIDSVQQVDAVEVVRCKVCKHIRPEVNAYTHEVVGHYCSLLDLGGMKAEDFCSYGERRNDG